MPIGEATVKVSMRRYCYHKNKSPCAAIREDAGARVTLMGECQL
jgi:hypothetical protein